MNLTAKTAHKAPRKKDKSGLAPKPAGIKPAIPAMTAVVAAYGIWVFTWSIWSEALAMDDIIVVSDIGEQWSPKTAPVITAPIVAYRMVPVSPPESVYTRGTDTGRRMAIVP